MYEWHKLGIKPWEWDYERYSEDRQDMIGFYYLEDLENIKQLDKLESDWNRRHPQQ